MQRDAWYTSMRCADEMASPEAVGRYAAERALSRLGARKIDPGVLWRPCHLARLARGADQLLP